ncbi:uncharacterized protein LOC102705172 [Oryza brachyantha]|uniref:uncharacterized protein LOC102705172 n=1 Tax=Oryza brachyantha TaxID=4533 RepID=UPI000776392A|nr:uncharacterized protein LOC102705172 [Oryza brachyantha]XP_040381398.1 uncharacterized protein LOC102705172 [Oryza brachyantha]
MSDPYEVRPVRRYDKSYRRFTWHNEVRNNLSILSVRRSAPDGKCSYYSIIAALEANLRIHHGFGHNLSIKYLQRKDKKVKIEKLLKDFDKKKRKIGRNVRIMDILRRTGVPTEEGYDLFCQAGLPCEMKRIQCYTMYDVKKPSQIRLALERHLIKGPMVAVFYISGNYDKCMKYGSVYVFNKKQVLRFKNEAISHSVCVVSFGLEGQLPFLLFRTEKIDWPAYGRVEIQSVKELYGIDV